MSKMRVKMVVQGGFAEMSDSGVKKPFFGSKSPFFGQNPSF